MTSQRERTLEALAHHEVRPVPYTVWYDAPTEAALDAHYGDTAWRERIRNHVHAAVSSTSCPT